MFFKTLNTAWMRASSILTKSKTVPTMPTSWLVALRNDNPLTARMVSSRSVSTMYSLTKLGLALLSNKRFLDRILCEDKQTEMKLYSFLLMRHIFPKLLDRQIAEYSSGFFSYFHSLYLPPVFPIFLQLVVLVPDLFRPVVELDRHHFRFVEDFRQRLLSPRAVFRLRLCCLYARR